MTPPSEPRPRWGVEGVSTPDGFGMATDVNKFTGLKFEAVDAKDAGGKTVRNLMISLKPRRD